MIGAPIGAILMPIIADRFGRRPTFAISSILHLIAITLSAISGSVRSFELFILGRTIFGVAGGIVMGVQGLYIAEIAPKSHRGFLNSLTAVTVELGFGMSSVVGLPTILGTGKLWPVAYWLEFGPIAFLLVGLFFVPESPKFLVSKNREIEAERAIRRLYGTSSVQSEIEMVTESEEDVKGSKKPEIGWLEIMGDSTIRKGIIIGSVINFITAGCGIYAFSSYSTQILTQTDFSESSAAYANAGLCCSTFLTSMIATLVVDKVGRRPLVLMGTFVMLILDIIMMILLIIFDRFAYAWIGYAILALTVLFMGTFGLTLGVVNWFIAVEVVPQPISSTAQTIALIMYYGGSLLSTFLFFPLEEAIGPYSFLMFIVPLLVSLIFLWYCFPETKNKSIEQVLEAEIKKEVTTKNLNDGIKF